MTDEPKVWMSAQVPPDLKREVESIAKHSDRPVSSVIRQALRRYVKDFGVEKEPA